MDRMTSPNFTDPRAPNQQTLALIRPEAMCNREAITQRICDAGFKILDSTIVKLSPEQAANLYADQIIQPAFPLKIVSLCSGPVQAMCLAKPEAIKEFRALLGAETASESRSTWPGSLRSYFGSCGIRNGILGSVDLQSARREIQFFFPNIAVEPVMVSPDDQLRYLNTFVYPILMEGIYAVAKQQPDDPVLDLAQWLWRNNPNRPSVCLFPIRLFEEIDAMKNDCRQWQLQSGYKLDSDFDLCPDDDGRRPRGLSVIAEMDEVEEFHRCPLNGYDKKKSPL